MVIQHKKLCREIQSLRFLPTDYGDQYILIKKKTTRNIRTYVNTYLCVCVFFFVCANIVD